MDSSAAFPQNHDAGHAPHAHDMATEIPLNEQQQQPLHSPAAVHPRPATAGQGYTQAQMQTQPQAQEEPRVTGPQSTTTRADSVHAPSPVSVQESDQPSEAEIITSDQGQHISQDTDSSASPLPATVEPTQDILASPRHELPLIPEDQPIDSRIASPLATSSVLNSNQPASSRASATSTPDPSIIRPAALRPTARPLSRPSSRSSISPIASAEPLSPAIIRTASSNSVLRHPVPDIDARSGSYTTNIAALEATAERFSMTSSIEDAIRDAHNELKRSDSRRSSILAASVRSAGELSTDGPQGQSSIVGLNNAARTGGYSPGGYIMSPTQSITGRLRSASKSSGVLSRANSTRSKPETLDGEAFPNLSAGSFLSRTDAGHGSVRSVRSARSVRSLQSVHSAHSSNSNPAVPASLAEIVEQDPPTTLTLDAMDEADSRAVPRLDDLADDDEAILARAHQLVEPDATDIEVADHFAEQSREERDRTPMLGDTPSSSYWNTHEEPQGQRHSPTNPSPAAHFRDEDQPSAEDHHDGAESHKSDNEDDMFADFDGMHCDPDSVAEQFPFHPEEEEEDDEEQGPAQRQPQARRRPAAARPKSYFDPETNQEMLYYPAPVPAMLNLPPKLGKGQKAAQAARNMRRSQVLSQMPKAARESRLWLPDPLENGGSSNLMGDEPSAGSHHSGSRGEDGPEHALDALEGGHADASMEPPELQHLRRPRKLGEDARKSRGNLSQLPPQLRASVFFDLPAESPKIVVKNGSAMDTLDSILDAAAAAPVNAFTDHAWAGHLGSEVYGQEKKKRQSQLTLAPGDGITKNNRLSKSTATLAVAEPEKRKSVWSLLPGRGKSRSHVNLLEVQEEDTRSRLSGSGGGDNDSNSDVDEHSALAPDDQEKSDDEEVEEQFTGPPTTLLAELQMRKQQQKNRTRNPLHYGDTLHSTLLERDAVAQVEARQRQQKKVNLAWATDSPDAESEDDEDVPLGILAAQKQLGPNPTERDVALAMQELNRPLGLMEKRELDDNEPLARRRDRLQGKPVSTSIYLQPGATGTRLAVVPGNSRSPSPRRMPRLSPSTSAKNLNAAHSGDEDEVEGETLGERMKRLRAKEEGESHLPRARPISRTFSEELLGEFGVDEEADKDKGKGTENAVPVIEEEETLGQRRRRLQAEREAREKEMATRAVSGSSQKVSKRMDMANVLAANPLEGPQGRIDPREAERLRKEEESIRVAREQESRMRAFRSQMPQALNDPRAGVVQPGGFAAGKFNDGWGGHSGPGSQAMGRNQQLRASMSMGQLGPYGHGQATNLVGAAGHYGNPQAGPDGLNPVFAKPNTFGRGYSGGFLQQPQFQEPSPFIGGSLLASGSMGGMGAYGGGVGAAGGYPVNQTAYGAGVGFANPMQMGYGMQMGGMPMVAGQRQTDRVESWRQSIR